MIYSFMRLHIKSGDQIGMYGFMQDIFKFINKKYDMCITVNYTSYAHKTSHRSINACNLDDGIVMFDLNHTVIHISDDEDADDGDAAEEASLREFFCAHSISLLNIMTPTVDLSSINTDEVHFMEFNNTCASVFSTALLSIRIGDEPKKICLLCECSLGDTSMAAHIADCLT